MPRQQKLKFSFKRHLATSVSHFLRIFQKTRIIQKLIIEYEIIFLTLIPNTLKFSKVKV